MSSLTAIKAESLRERVAQALEQALAGGELAPGELISVPVLAQRFDVSATPVREALLKLASRGIVAPVRNRGFRVTQISEREVDEHLELRLLVEPWAVAEAAARIEAEALVELRAQAKRGRAAARAGDWMALLEHDRTIHLGLLAWCGNPAAVELVRSLLEEERLRGALRGGSGRMLADLARRDGELVDAVARGDGEGAAEAVRAQLATLRRVWVAGVAAT